IGFDDFAFLGRAVTTVLLGHAVLLIRTAPRSKSSAQAVQPKGRTPNHTPCFFAIFSMTSSI
ncbi:hypothetical protein, partial [Paracoccus rhizosphaerae]|uniref:hypothetical protein n=1 Tax=Paracoccus rhizosphaerae TaxID=1133347 RepID=UPI002240A8F6